MIKARAEQPPKPSGKKKRRKPEGSADPQKAPANKTRPTHARKATDIVPNPPEAPAIHLRPVRTRSEPPAPPPHASDELVQKWAARGADLLRELATHGAEEHEYRVDLKDGRFVWVDRQGRVSAEARAAAIASYSPATASLTMAWADPLLRPSSIPRVELMQDELDDLDEETAWRVAIAAAEASNADYLYRVAAPNTWYFLALTRLSFQPLRPSFTPGTPAGLVLSEIETSRKALASGAEPARVVRERLARVGSALLQEAAYAYRGTDWVARLARTGKRIENLASKVHVPSFESVASGLDASEWLTPTLASELDDALRLLEDEWRHFA